MRIMELLPPGAGNKQAFLQRCIHCGQCAEACRFDAIRIADGMAPQTSGTPFIAPEKAPCFLCMHCGPACPSGAIPVIEQHEAAMGAALLHKDLCHTYQGSIICRTCFEKCPLRNSALVLEYGLFPVITDKCVGCGVCFYVCPQKAISLISAQNIREKAEGGA